MVESAAVGYQRIIPYIAYADAAAAIDFLCSAFGFEERSRIEMPDGRVGHAEVGSGECVVMLASEYEELGFVGPRQLPSVHGQIFCYVDDVDAHHVRAREAGATILSEPSDEHGDRSYRAVDPEGHRWIFATHLDD